MKTMPSATRSLRIILASASSEFSSGIASWVDLQKGMYVAGSARTIAETLALATVLRPDVILLDFHGLSAPTSYAVSLFKELLPEPTVFVLTHDGSSVMRRRCLLARADGVFDKTWELGSLHVALGRLAHGIATIGNNRH